MSNDYDHPEEVRSPVEIAHFALGFAGFVTAAAGIVTTTPAAAITGALMILLGLAFFAVNSN